MDDEDIQSIQNHIINKAPLLLSKHLVYSEQSSFELLPGHRKVLFTLKQKAIEFAESLNKSNSKIFNEQTNEQVALLTEDEVEQLREKLIEKLNECVQRIPGSNFTVQNIVSTIDPYISRNARSIARGIAIKPSYKCTVKCTECEKHIPCTFNGHWSISNFQNHLKSHINLNSNELELERVLEF